MTDIADRDVERLSPLLMDLFQIDAVYRHDQRLAFSLTARYDRDQSVKILRERLHTAGYEFQLSQATEGPVVVTVDPRRRWRIPRLNIALLIATVLSIYLVPVLFKCDFNMNLVMIRLRAGDGVRFAVALISILIVHEMGHYLAGRRRGIVTTWPYFIPAPNLFGTFGAVIKQKSPFWNRRDLLEVGAAGPIAGWVIAILWLSYGLAQSTMVPVATLTPDQLPFAFSLQGESFLMRSLTTALTSPPHDGYAYVLSEYAFAGWAGLLVTAINLLPIGQLDGGHVLYGLVGRKQQMFAWGAVAALVVLGFWSPTWWVFAVLGFVFKVQHPPTLDDYRRPTTIALLLGIVALVILAVSFTPVPFQ